MSREYGQFLCCGQNSDSAVSLVVLMLSINEDDNKIETLEDLNL